MVKRSFAVCFALAMVFVASVARAQDEDPRPPGRVGLRGTGGAVEFGLRTGYGIPLGHTGKAAGDTEDDKLSNTISGEIPLWLDLGYRFDPNLYLGLSFQYAFGFVPDGQCGSGASCSVSDLRLGANFMYHVTPEQPADFWVGFGAGYEWLQLSLSALGVTVDGSGGGFEFANFQMGVDVAATPAFALGPFVSFSLGQYRSFSISGNGTIAGPGSDRQVAARVAGAGRARQLRHPSLSAARGRGRPPVGRHRRNRPGGLLLAWRGRGALSKVPGALDATLVSVLACPSCNGPLNEADGALLCAACQTRYPIRDGVPRFSDGLKDQDERLKAEWEAQSNAGPHYANPIIIMNRWEEEQVMPHILSQLDDVTGPVLDAGCGVGHLGQTLDRMGRRDINLVGTDFQGELLARVTVGYAGLAEADVHHLPFKSGAFSAVLTSNALHHFPDPYRAMVEIARVLKPGGVFVCYDPRYVTPLEMVKKFLRRNDNLFTKDHKAFRVDEYRDLLGSSGLSVTEVRTVDTIAPLLATALDYLKVGKLGIGPQVAKLLASVDRAIEGSRHQSPLGLMLVGRAVKPL